MRTDSKSFLFSVLDVLDLVTAKRYILNERTKYHNVLILIVNTNVYLYAVYFQNVNLVYGSCPVSGRLPRSHVLAKECTDIVWIG